MAHSPAEDLLAEGNEIALGERLCQHVHQLILGLDYPQQDDFVLNEGVKVMKLDVEVLGLRPHLGELGYFKSTGIVLKSLVTDVQYTL